MLRPMATHCNIPVLRPELEVGVREGAVDLAHLRADDLAYTPRAVQSQSHDGDRFVLYGEPCTSEIYSDVMADVRRAPMEMTI
jgi:hypothetical protein